MPNKPHSEVGAEAAGNSRRAYIARYPLAANGDDLDEVILARDSHWSEKMNALWDSLIASRGPFDPMLQGWYCDENMTVCMATTNQPFRLS